MFERVNTIEAFRALRGEWQELYRAAGVSNPFLSYDWIEPWLAYLSRRFAVLYWRDQPGGPIVAAGVFTTEQAGRWCFISEHNYHPGLLVRVDAASPPHMYLRRFLIHIFTREPLVWHMILHRSVDDAAVRAMVARGLGPLRFLCTESPRVVPEYIVDTAASFDEYLTDRPGKVRKELRRKLRRVERELPEVRFTELPADAGGQAALDIIARVEEDSWKSGTHTAIISHRRERDFYSAVFEIAGERSRGRLFSLSDAGGALAYVIGVQHDRTFYALKTSYRADHARYAPGQVLFAYLIRHLCESDVDNLELLGTDARWKRELATRSRAVRTFKFMRPDPIGLGYVLAEGHLRPAIRSAAERDPRVARLWDLAKRAKRGLGALTARTSDP
ncbi:GNAT family N-acetyltransferase [Haliangium sp.]|uniref:GNAT family N-acetyltransferase n=1 Tax=Haliangium sp. TaxID=2663208 RepID=UPI003D146B01